MDKNTPITITAEQASGVLFDIDDVIANTCSPLHKALLLETGQDIPIDQWTCHNLTTVYSGVDEDCVTSIIGRYNVLSEALPISGAIQALSIFRERGYTIHLCTARGLVSEYKSITTEWLNRYKVPYDTITYVPYGSSKSQAYANVSDEFAYLFDDAPSNIDDAIDSQIVIKPTLVTKPWNVCEEKYLRTPSLIDFCGSVGWV